MAVHDLEERIRDKFERKMEQLAERLTELEQDEELRSATDEVAAELDELDAELEGLAQGETERPYGLKERLEAKRERLLAKQERLRMKADLRQERQARLQESLSEMQIQLEESVSRVREQAQERIRRSVDRQARYAPSPPSAGGARKLQEERRKILEMVQRGTISADDAAQLLDALRDQEEGARQPRRRPRWVRIRVTDASEEKVRVNLTLPVGLVRAGLRAGGSIAGVEGLDTSALEEMLDRGEVGHILDIEDDSGDRVEVFVE